MNVEHELQNCWKTSHFQKLMLDCKPLTLATFVEATEARNGWHRAPRVDPPEPLTPRVPR